MRSIGNAKCMNCGHTWGGHSGIYCYHGEAAKDGKKFQPLGYALSDICENCGETLLDHWERYQCRRNNSRGKKVFKKDNNLFSDGDFIL